MKKECIHARHNRDFSPNYFEYQLWSVTTYLYAEGTAQHGGARRAGNNAASSIEILGPEDDHCRVPDTVQWAA